MEWNMHYGHAIYEFVSFIFKYTEPQKKRLLYYFIRCDYMAFLHLVKAVRDVFQYKCLIWTLFSEQKLL